MARSKAKADEGPAEQADPDEVAEPSMEGQPSPLDPDADPDPADDAVDGQDEPITAVPAEAAGPEAVDVETAAASPLAPPVERARQVAPQAGDSARAPAAVVRKAPGHHMHVEDEDGNEIDPDDLFEAVDGPSTMMRVKRRVFQVFRYPGTHTPVRQLLLPQPGVMMAIPRAHKLVADLKAVQAEQAGGQA